MRRAFGVVISVLLGAAGCSAQAGSRDTSNGISGGAAGSASGGASALPLSGGDAAGSSATGSTTNGGASPGAGAPATSGGALGLGGAPVTSGDAHAHVITWVPTYHIAEAKQQLSASFDGTGMADGLSFLALQFWQTNGASATLQASEADVAWFHDWARQHGVKVLVCVHNFTTDWDWPAAEHSFKDNGAAFAQSLISQVKTRDFDGVDLDLEGIVDATADDQRAYQQLVQALADALHPLGKVVTMDSFHGQWNAPNWSWWPDLLPVVDGITSMGYEQSGKGVDYQTLVDHAAIAPQKLMIGVPSYQGSWQNNTVGEQLGWLVEQGHVGTAIWDASLSAPEWRQKSVWDQLELIKAR